jgi:DNA-binding MarR family transcriptional regulator
MINGQSQTPCAVSNDIPAALSNSAGFLLNRAARLIRQMNSEALKPTGLSLRDLGILRLVSSEGPLSQQALSDRHKTDRTTIVDTVDLLEQRRLVVRLTNEKDRRSYLVTITPRGEKVLARANRLTRKEQKKYLSALSEEEWQSLRSLLIRLISFHEGRPSTAVSERESAAVSAPESADVSDAVCDPESSEVSDRESSDVSALEST